MIKAIILTLFLILLYFSISIYIVPKSSTGDFVAGLLAYLIGLGWIVPYILDKNMPQPYIDEDLTPERKNRWKRLFFFIIGLTISVSAALSVPN